MRIISASRRTDIPAFYSAWLFKRLRAGFCHWINPFGGQVYQVSLRPEDVLAIVFWTRNPRPLLSHLAALRGDGYRFYFHVTINGYPQPIETHSPPLPGAIEAFQRLSDAISPDLALWRYDPIVLSNLTPAAYHLAQFDTLSRRLRGYTKRCYFSFVDFYGKTARNLKQSQIDAQQPSLEQQRQLAQTLGQIAASRGMALYSCCGKELAGEGVQPPYPPTLGGTTAQGADGQPPCPPTLGGTAGALLPQNWPPEGDALHPQGWGSGGAVQQAHCIDLGIVRQVRGDATLTLKAAPTRRDCGCVAATDIGAYDTCVFGCTYCYATNSRAAALRRRHEHDPEDTVLWRPAALRGVNLAIKDKIA